MMMCVSAVLLVLLCVLTANSHTDASPIAWSAKRGGHRVPTKSAILHILNLPEVDRQSSSSSASFGKYRGLSLGLLPAFSNRIGATGVKRARADGGFFSRHDAMSDYLQSARASALASDLYGPGKRK